jgi:hypothetical protein
MSSGQRKFLLAALALACAALVVWLVVPERQSAFFPASTSAQTAPAPEVPLAAAGTAESIPANASKLPVAVSVPVGATAQVPAPGSPTVTQASSSSSASTSGSVPHTAESTATPPSATAEAIATAQMYAAHAPLRVPEVADPDSKTNREILQTMIRKAVAAPATPSPQSN